MHDVAVVCSVFVRTYLYHILLYIIMIEVLVVLALFLAWTLAGCGDPRPYF